MTSGGDKSNEGEINSTKGLESDESRLSEGVSSSADNSKGLTHVDSGRGTVGEGQCSRQGA